MSPYRSNGRERDPIEDGLPSPLAILKKLTYEERLHSIYLLLREELDKTEKHIEDMRMPLKDERSRGRKAFYYFLEVCWTLAFYRFN